MDLHAWRLFGLLVLWSLVTLAYFSVKDIPLACCDFVLAGWIVTLIFTVVPATLPLLGAHFAARQIQERSRHPLLYRTTLFVSFGPSIGLVLLFICV